MHASGLRGPRALALLLLACTTPVVAAAQSALPPAREILERYGKAIGADAWKSHKSARMKAKMEMPAAGMSMEMEVVQVFPRAFVQKLVMPGMGNVMSGFDGTVAWSMNPMEGPKVLAGMQAEGMKEDADPENAARMSAAIASSETVEKSNANGSECYKVKHTWKSGRTSFDCFSVADGLLLSTTRKEATSMGEMEVTQYYSDYKEVGGMKRATTISSQMMGQSMNITVTGWEWDNVDAKEVELPAEIKALVEKKP
jgi:hypothetical protein